LVWIPKDVIFLRFEMTVVYIGIHRYTSVYRRK